ncbi:MAG: hypothetical protein CfClM3_0046 [Methanobrevibacter sp. CfCl-M3]
MNIKETLRLQLSSIEKTLQFSIFLMIFSFTYLFVNIMLGSNMESAINFIDFYQVVIPLWFFAMFDGGFKDINDFGFNSSIIKKFIKVFVINWVFIVFLITMEYILKEVKLFF